MITSGGSACPGPCNARLRRSGEGVAAAGEPVWCARCAELIRTRLLDLDRQATRLVLLAGSHSSAPQEERVSGSRGRPSPAPHIDDLDELVRTLTGWEDAYRAERGFASRPRRGRFEATLTGAIGWLSRHISGLLAFDGAADFGREVLLLHRKLVRHTSTGPHFVRVRQVCPGCDLRSLSREDGTDVVRCRNQNCGRTLSLRQLGG
jgi:hypothetical protein